jgi:hypothetical protein
MAADRRRAVALAATSGRAQALQRAEILPGPDARRVGYLRAPCSHARRCCGARQPHFKFAMAACLQGTRHGARRIRTAAGVGLASVDSGSSTR